MIHTVGPVWQGGGKGEAKTLASCYINSLRLAIDHKCKRITFPSISTGIYNYPKAEAAQVAVDSIHQFVQENDVQLEIVLVCFDADSLDYIRAAAANIM